MNILKINDRDNVAVATVDVAKGQSLVVDENTIIAVQAIKPGHKIALRRIPSGEPVIKYGFPIGTAKIDIEASEWVHTHNVQTGLNDMLKYTYSPSGGALPNKLSNKTFQGYRRADGKVGTRNEIWIIPTVGCVNRNARIIAETASKRLVAEMGVDGVYAFEHPFGCSQMGEDERNTQNILAGLVRHPNAAGVLILGLGCENNNIKAFQKVLGNIDPARVKFLQAQDVEDEIEEGLRLVAELTDYASNFKRESCPTSDLIVGLKCGGSDGFSGITANPLVGSFSDLLIAADGSTVLTEVPEMFGAETILMNRARDKATFEKIVELINRFKAYFKAHNQVIYENPSPGNKDGGITTLEDKSLGCVQKGGTLAPVVDVLEYGEAVRERGLSLLNGPGNDLVAATVLAAAGCQLILFTTGRGTPLGTAVPTIKVATNTDLFRRKANWMDFDAGRLLTATDRSGFEEEFFTYVLSVASGEVTKAELLGFREIALFKTGVTL